MSNNLLCNCFHGNSPKLMVSSFFHSPLVTVVTAAFLPLVRLLCLANTHIITARLLLINLLDGTTHLSSPCPSLTCVFFDIPWLASLSLLPRFDFLKKHKLTDSKESAAVSLLKMMAIESVEGKLIRRHVNSINVRDVQASPFCKGVNGCPFPLFVLFLSPTLDLLTKQQQLEATMNRLGEITSEQRCFVCN